MTTPLYYDDPLETVFTATIKEILTDEPALILDATRFYPEGGGQPADTGTLGGVPVKDVRKRDDGVILHVVDRVSGFQVGDTIDGMVNWDHRFEYMQQHSGQHVLSAALMSVAGAGTVSVAQGSDVTNIEVDAESLNDETIAAVEARANEIIREDLPIEGFWIDDSELGAYSLRRPTKRRGKIRLVRIGAADNPVDLVACGGVHLPRTGLLNLVQTVAAEKIRGHLRLHFKIGSRALDDYREKHRTVTVAAELFSAQPADLPERIRAEQAEIQELHRTARLRAERIATLLLDSAPLADGTMCLTDENSDIFKALIETAASRSRPGEAVLFTNRRDDAVDWAIVIGIGDGHAFPSDRLRTGLLQPFGAKGGGKPPLWRGIIPSTDAEVVTRFADAFRTLFRSIA